MRAISPAWRQARWKLHDLTIVCQKPTQSPGTGINVSLGTSFKYAGSIIEKDRCQLLELGLVKYSWNLSLALKATRPNWLQSPNSFILEKKEGRKKIITTELENGKKKNEANRSNARKNSAVAIHSIRREYKKMGRITKKKSYETGDQKMKKEEEEKVSWRSETSRRSLYFYDVASVNPDSRRWKRIGSNLDPAKRKPRAEKFVKAVARPVHRCCSVRIRQRE